MPFESKSAHPDFSVEVCHGKIRMRLRMRLLCSLQNGLFRLLAKNVEEAGT